MKTIKILLLLVAFSTATFYSCSDENAIKNESSAQRSTALRTVLNKLKLENTAPSNRSAQMSENPVSPMLCFEFVFPITFSYNNGTVISATSLDGLLDILNNESPNLYLSGVVFPFQVQTGGAVQTIADEADLIALIIQCGLPTFNDDLEHSYCFDIVFPIQAGSGWQEVTINSQQELNAYLNNPNNGSEASIIFPISVIEGNQTTVINNLYEFYDLVNSCNGNDCVCTLEYLPVCVQTPNGVIEFSNTCFAMCAGYTQNDFMLCTPITECSITNFTAVPGACNPNGTYEMTINFNPGNTTAEYFEVWANDNNVIGLYPIASLPVTIPNYPVSLLGIPFGVVKVTINENNEQCVATQQFNLPNCGGTCVCTADVNPVCVQTPTGIVEYTNSCWAVCDGYTSNDFVPCIYNFSELLGTCFEMNYPVSVQYQGAIQQVFSNGELLQYWNTTNGQMPIMNYPITVMFNNNALTFADQTSFERAILSSCP